MCVSFRKGYQIIVGNSQLRFLLLMVAPLEIFENTFVFYFFSDFEEQQLHPTATNLADCSLLRSEKSAMAEHAIDDAHCIEWLLLTCNKLDYALMSSELPLLAVYKNMYVKT